MPYSPTSGRAHSRNGAEHLRSPTPRPVYSSSSCTIPFMIPCALRACTWCAASPRNVQVRLVCHVSTSVPSVCLRACTCVSVNLDSDNSFHSGVCARALCPLSRESCAHVSVHVARLRHAPRAPRATPTDPALHLADHARDICAVRSAPSLVSAAPPADAPAAPAPATNSSVLALNFNDDPEESARETGDENGKAKGGLRVGAWVRKI